MTSARIYFTACIADRSAVRLWSEDDTASERITIENVYSPYHAASAA
ncbi:hypothetical protein [Sodalis sp.]